MVERTIAVDQAGQRLDKYLKRLFSGVPHSHIYKLLRLRRVRVNGKRSTGSTLLAEGDKVVVRGDDEKLLAPRPATAVQNLGPPLVILYEDEHLLAVDKPAGLAVHPGTGIEGATLVDLARAHVGQVPVGEFGPAPAHRLDRETSGVVLIAKSRRAMVHFTELFTAGTISKRYLALVKGRLSTEHGRIDLPLPEHEQTAKSRAAFGIKLQHAVTHWETLARGTQVTLLSCRIETGRTHQIRRHLAAIGHPVAGDKRHGDFAFNRVLRTEGGLRRMFLHAEWLKVRHPTRAVDLELRAPLPSELVSVLDNLGLSAADRLSRNELPK